MMALTPPPVSTSSSSSPRAATGGGDGAGAATVEQRPAALLLHHHRDLQQGAGVHSGQPHDGRLVDALVERVFEALPPALALQKAIARVYQIVVQFPSVIELVAGMNEHVSNNGEGNDKQLKGEEFIRNHKLNIDLTNAQNLVKQTRGG
jgi:hypothetical protein